MNTPSSATSSNNPVARQHRGAIATQACETCRARKQKCDENRPKCSLCQRMKLDCTYREPLPTKKDKTLVEILERLRAIESKVDRIPLGASGPSGFGTERSSPPSRPSFPNVDPSSTSSTRLPTDLYEPDPNTSKSQPYRHASAAHKMLTWPAIQQLLLQAVPSNFEDLKSLEYEGSAFIVRLHQGLPLLPLDDNLEGTPFVGMQSQATRTAGGLRVTFPALTRDVMHRLSAAYFDTFNLLYPFMDRQTFLQETIIKVQTEGFDGDNDSVIALLVLALGELAIEGSHGRPVEEYHGRASGVRGGTLSRPPGLALFNEARKQMGFLLTQCDLENVQIFSLTALYYQSCSRHLDFWRMTVSASQACQILITCNAIDWNSPRGDVTKRAFWHCLLMETGLHLELDLPLTGLLKMEGKVPLPSFNSPFCEADHRSNQSSHFEAHYTSQLALRGLCANFHDTINDSMNTNDSTPRSEDFVRPTPATLRLLASGLLQWRGLLPPELQWSDEDASGYPSPQQLNTALNQPVDPKLSPQRGDLIQPLFMTDLNSEPAQHSYLYDVQVALLRTRFYYAQYMTYRPFVFKALHYPEAMSQDDAEGVAECLKACLKWPITLSPTSRRKRLIPYLFCWSQNFLGILLILHMTRHNSMLREIRAQLCGQRFEEDTNVSISLMLDWIRDLKSTDPIALWCWKIVRGIYDVE